MIKKALMIALIALATTSVADAKAEKVLICHATSSATNPVVMISVSANAVDAQLAQGSTLAVKLPGGIYICGTDIPPDPV